MINEEDGMEEHVLMSPLLGKSYNIIIFPFIIG